MFRVCFVPHVPRNRRPIIQPYKDCILPSCRHGGLSGLLVMATLRSRCGHYIFVLFRSSSFLFFPRLISALLYGTPVLGVSQTLRRWTEGATYIRQAGHHVWHRLTFLVFFILSKTFHAVCFAMSVYSILSKSKFKVGYILNYGRPA